jgi:hypothetical protein
VTQREISQALGYLTEAQASERLQELEAKYDLFRFTVDGHSAWQLLRFRAAGVLQNLPFAAQSHTSRWNRIWVMLAKGIVGIPGLLLIKPSRYVAKTFSSALAETESGRWKDVYFDDLLLMLGECAKIEVRNNPQFASRSQQALIPITITTDSVDLLASCLHKLISVPEISPVAKDIAHCLSIEPELNSFTSRRIAAWLSFFCWSKAIYSRLLRRIRPDFVLVADTSEYPICAAAQSLGIQTIEFQHGLFSSNHPDALPAFANSFRESLVIHDKILLYGEYWKLELEKNKFYSNELCVVGSIRIDRYRRFREEYIATKPEGCPTFLVLTTQGFAVEELIGFVHEFTLLIEGKLHYHLVIKLHPIYDRNSVPYKTAFVQNQSVRVFLGTDGPSTMELLAKADLHLSVSSACHFDAIGLGVPTAILALRNHETVMPLIDRGHAILAKSPKDLADIVTAVSELKVSSETSAFYFRPGALDNILAELGLQK